MARKKTTLHTFVKETLQDAEIVDLQIQISSRGRSVMNGTMLVKGRLQAFHRELESGDVISIARSALGVLSVGETD